jgi:hypothetical protein
MKRCDHRVLGDEGAPRRPPTHIERAHDIASESQRGVNPTRLPFLCARPQISCWKLGACSQERGNMFYCRQGRIVGVSCGAAAKEGRAIGNVQRCADPQALHEIGIGDIGAAERDEVGEIAAACLGGEFKVVAVVRDIETLE